MPSSGLLALIERHNDSCCRWTQQRKPEPAADNGNDGRVLAVDIEQDDDGYTLMADVPGLAKEDLKVVKRV